MTKHLHISKNLSLPIEVAGEAIGILATRGAGKSYTSAVLVEELWDAGIQLAVVDPTGVYWGLRAGATGDTKGLPIIVLGGAHGDAPLEPTAGALIADVLVDTGQSLIVDFSDFGTKGEQTRFVTAFAERLYARKARNRTTLHLIIDESDEFAPQRPMKDEPRMLGAMERLVRRGRSRGIGVTLITQRSAALNKNVLDVVDTLLAMRMPGPRDRAAVASWITAKSESDELGILDSLPGLPTGTAWGWSPVRGLLQQVPMRRIRTFDSYATPKPGEKLAEPHNLVPIDVAKLGREIEATKERTKAEDPRELRKKIADIEREHHALLQKGVAAVTNLNTRLRTIAGLAQKIAEAASVNGDLPNFEQQRLTTMAVSQAKEKVITQQRTAAAPTLARSRSGADVSQAKEKVITQQRTAAAPTLARSRSGADVSQAKEKVITQQRTAAAPTLARSRSGADDLTGPEQRIINAIAWLHSIGVDEPEQVAVAFLAGYTYGGGGYNNPRSSLNAKGLLEYVPGNRIRLTEAGQAAADPVTEPLTTDELHQKVLERLPGPEQRLLRPLLEAYPQGMGDEELAAASNYTAGSGGFNNPKGRLRTLGLIEYPQKRTARARDILFL